jgi:hypothetical protein
MVECHMLPLLKEARINGAQASIAHKPYQKISRPYSCSVFFPSPIIRALSPEKKVEKENIFCPASFTQHRFSLKVDSLSIM